MKSALSFSIVLSLFATSSSFAALWTSGHGDIGIAYDANTGEWEPHFAFHEEEGGGGMEEEHGHPIIDGAEPIKEEYEIDELSIRVLGPRQPGAGIGESGALEVFLLSEDELQAEALGNPWPGIAVEEIQSGVFLNDLVSLSLQNVSGPGVFSLWNTDPFAGATVVMSSAPGSSAPGSVDLLLDPGHFHFNAGFSEPGTYDVLFRAEGELVAGGMTSTDFTVRYEVVPIPEPSSLALLLLGGMAALRRKRN